MNLGLRPGKRKEIADAQSAAGERSTIKIHINEFYAFILMTGFPHFRVVRLPSIMLSHERPLGAQQRQLLPSFSFTLPILGQK